jgi:hypothetical protein
MWHQINVKDEGAWWIGKEEVTVYPKILAQHFYLKPREVM